MKQAAAPNSAKEITEVTFELLANCQRKEERLAESFGISVPEFRAIRFFRGEKELPMAEMVSRLQLSPSRVTRIIEGLENRGLLERSIDLEDRRNVKVSLTGRGVGFSATLEERYVRMHEEILEGIPAELHPTLATALQKLLASLSRWLKVP